MTTPNIVTQLVNRTEISWNEAEPLKWTASTKVADDAPKYSKEFDFSEFQQVFEKHFLMNFKTILVGRYRRCKRKSVENDIFAVTQILKKIQAQQLSPNERLVKQDKIAAVDIGLLTAIRAKLADHPDWINAHYLKTLKALFKYAGEGSLFIGVTVGDFPNAGQGRSLEDLFRSRIIAQALSRSAQIAVLKNIEDGFQKLEIDLALYSFWNLAHHLFIRPESYRQITCGDLTVGEDKETKKRTYVLMVIPVKRRKLRPQPMPYELDEQMGELLVLQRQSVIHQNGPLHGIDPLMPDEERKLLENRLALFPRRVGERKPFDIKHFGILETGRELANNYLRPLQRRLVTIKFGFNVMRHTIATHLGAAGCSTQTIQAVLKHASADTARIYVDLATKELAQRLSQGLEGMAELFPAYKVFTTQENAKMNPIRTINSINVDPETGEIKETTPGECGGSKACDYAPVACYGCWRFIPALDADHSINLKKALKSIDRYKKMGRPFKHLLDRDEELKLNIEFVIAQCSKQRQLNAMQSDTPQNVRGQGENIT